MSRGCTGAVVAGARAKRCSTMAATSTISLMANRLPMRLRITVVAVLCCVLGAAGT